jgi:hypothetical protein
MLSRRGERPRGGLVNRDAAHATFGVLALTGRAQRPTIQEKASIRRHGAFTDRVGTIADRVGASTVACGTLTFCKPASTIAEETTTSPARPFIPCNHAHIAGDLIFNLSPFEDWSPWQSFGLSARSSPYSGIAADCRFPFFRGSPLS